MAKSNKVVVSVCLCGAGTKKAQAPTVPYTAGGDLAEQRPSRAPRPGASHRPHPRPRGQGWWTA